MQEQFRSVLAMVASALAIGILVLLALFGRPDREALVVYCSHDSIYSEEILRDFERRTGIPVVIRFDSEATKSLSLTSLILAEREHPQCDVFWNNEVLGTMRLAEAGVLEGWKGSGWQRVPESFKDPEGLWAGFGARMRVWIVNLEHIPATAEAVQKRLTENDLSRVTMARPLYGTTLTHYAALWLERGEEPLKQWHHDVRRRGLREVNGNAVVKNLVAGGTCDCGWTDTDDFFLAVDDGYPVAMLPVRTDSGQTIAIPNSAAIIAGTRHRDAARQLVDYLLSEETELRLARSRARQIPLGEVDRSRLPDEVRSLTDAARQSIDMRQLPDAYSACLNWLTAEYSE